MSERCVVTIRYEGTGISPLDGQPVRAGPTLLLHVRADGSPSWLGTEHYRSATRFSRADAVRVCFGLEIAAAEVSPFSGAAVSLFSGVKPVFAVVPVPDGEA